MKTPPSVVVEVSISWSHCNFYPLNDDVSISSSHWGSCNEKSTKRHHWNLHWYFSFMNHHSMQSSWQVLISIFFQAWLQNKNRPSPLPANAILATIQPKSQMSTSSARDAWNKAHVTHRILNQVSSISIPARNEDIFEISFLTWSVGKFSSSYLTCVLCRSDSEHWRNNISATATEFSFSMTSQMTAASQACDTGWTR